METSFILWAAEKKVKDSDLIFFHCLKSATHQEIYHRLAGHMAQLHPSFSDGISTLELLTELILMGHDQELFKKMESFESWKSHLKSLRYPHTTDSDEILKNKMQSWPWPAGAKIKFERRGDRAGVELKFFISSSVDVKKLSAALERVQQEMTL